MNRTGILSVLLVFSLAVPITAQTSSSSSSSSSQEGSSSSNSTVQRRSVDAAGSAITLETSEALFTIAAGLNACGYNAELDRSLPVRAQIRTEMEHEIAQSQTAQDARSKLCDYIVGHQLAGALNLSQYISLALFTTQPPELTISVPETEMPPDSLQVVNVLPLLRTFAEATHLHVIWLKHRPDYEAAVARLHDPLTRVLLDTNIYLKQPVSSYDGRRFVILLEPLLSPAATNARIYGADYFVVTSPTAPAADATPADGGVRLDDLRHSYLHYEVEPLIYARASSTERLTPLLKTVQDAPIDFIYKNDIVALVTECLIKAIEARTMDVGFPKPKRPVNVRQRSEIDRYNQDLIDYERRAEIVRRRQVAGEMRQGWVLTEYLYNKLAQMESAGVSLKEDIGEMVYGMDVQHEVNHVKEIVFDKQSKRDVLAGARVSRPKPLPTGLDLGEMKLRKGDLDGAEAIAHQERAKSPDRALYLLARVDLMRHKPEDALEKFKKIVETSHDPETLAWAHIYLGRLYDTETEPERDEAVKEYKAALAISNLRMETRAAAEAGLKQPFGQKK
ncbi:MAG: hypothetical protein JSS87_04750 [Acidobacteria bacterium]|nr:hypothetical protein [Acidobacteriota bacterium]